MLVLYLYIRTSSHSLYILCILKSILLYILCILKSISCIFFVYWSPFVVYSLYTKVHSFYILCILKSIPCIFLYTKLHFIVFCVYYFNFIVYSVYTEVHFLYILRTLQLVYCLHHFKGDEKARPLIHRLIDPSEEAPGKPDRESVVSDWLTCDTHMVIS